MTQFSYSVQKDGDAFGYLYENDIIHSINGELVTSTKQFVSAMKSATTPRIHVVIARMSTSAFANDVTSVVSTAISSPAPVAATISQMSTVDSQVDKLNNMSIRPRKSIGKPPLSLVQDTPTQIFQPTQTPQITNTQDILEQERETHLELTLESSLESYPIPSTKSPISTAQVEFWIDQETRFLIGRHF